PPPWRQSLRPSGANCLRNAHRELTSCSSLSPGKGIFVPGTLTCGFLMYSLNVSSFQTMPEDLFASEYLNPSTEPAGRPTRPLRVGAARLRAPSPTIWQGAHFLNTSSPAPISCAGAALTDTVANSTVTGKILIRSLPSPRGDPPGLARAVISSRRWVFFPASC